MYKKTFCGPTVRTTNTGPLGTNKHVLGHMHAGMNSFPLLELQGYSLQHQIQPEGTGPESPCAWTRREINTRSSLHNLRVNALT